MRPLLKWQRGTQILIPRPFERPETNMLMPSNYMGTTLQQPLCRPHQSQEGSPTQVVEMPCHLGQDQLGQNESHPPQMPLLTQKRETETKPSQWRFTPLNQREVPVALGVIGWRMRKHGNSRAPGATSKGEVPLSTREKHELCFLSPSAMRPG